MVDAHPRLQRLRRRVAQALEGLLGPAHHAVRGLLPLDPAQLLRVVAGLGHEPRVLDRVLGRLDHHVAGGVEPGAPRAAGDLVELARLQQPLVGAVELRQPGEDHGPDRDVDADAERVGPADHLQQPGLRQLLDQPPVARQHAGVVDADAAADELRERLAEAGGEAKAADRLGDRVALFARAELGRQQRLRALQRRGLREVHDVGRNLVGPHQLLEQLVQRLHRPREVQRHRAHGVVDQGRLAPGPPRQVVAQCADVAEGARHQQELRLRQAQDRHLPRPAALRLGVEVKLVHHDLADVGVHAFAQRDVGQHLGRAADDRGAAVDRRVARQHAHVVRAEDRAQREELLRHERLDRRGVERDPVVGQRGEVGRDRHQRLPRAGRRSQDHVVGAEQLDRRLFLVRVEAQPLLLRPAHERLVDGVGIGLARKNVDKPHAESQYGERRLAS